MKPAKFLLIILLMANGLLGCDSVSTYHGNEVVITKKMKEKVQKVQAGLREHCDSMLNREAQKMADSMKINSPKH